MVEHVKSWALVASVDGTYRTNVGEVCPTLALDVVDSTVDPETGWVLATPGQFYEWLDANYPGWRTRRTAQAPFVGNLARGSPDSTH